MLHTTIIKDVNFVEVISIHDKELKLSSPPNIDGLSFKDFEPNRARLANAYSEAFFLDYESGKILPAAFEKHIQKEKPLESTAPKLYSLFPTLFKIYAGRRLLFRYRSRSIALGYKRTLYMDLSYNPGSLTRGVRKEIVSHYKPKIKKPEVLRELKDRQGFQSYSITPKF